MIFNHLSAASALTYRPSQGRHPFLRCEWNQKGQWLSVGCHQLTTSWCSWWVKTRCYKIMDGQLLKVTIKIPISLHQSHQSLCLKKCGLGISTPQPLGGFRAQASAFDQEPAASIVHIPSPWSSNTWADGNRIWGLLEFSSILQWCCQKCQSLNSHKLLKCSSIGVNSTNPELQPTTLNDSLRWNESHPCSYSRNGTGYTNFTCPVVQCTLLMTASQCWFNLIHAY